MNLIFNNENKRKYCNLLSENLPVLRAKLGITQEDLANRIGISRNMLALIETEKKEMSWVTFVALSLLFLKNENTAAIFRSLEIYDENLNDYLMFQDKVQK